ncbi:MAG: hypothetical protein JW757_03635 [Anaerolineales bacterium]|nr:hypothetical protein [Anaerolineales bacterium]
MTTSKLIYLPLAEESPPGVLTQFLPRLPAGAAAAWLGNTLTETGQWVVDPFGASPQLTIEAAKAGYRVLVISNNPITRFILDLLANPPAEEAMQAALADLATAKRGQERLEHHIRELYTTRCDHCGRLVDAAAYLWASDTLTPYARVYACPNCQHAGEFPTSEEDLEKVSRFSHRGQHWALALQRVTSSDDPNRFHAEEALDAHLPRAVYALITMINKLDGIDLEGDEAKYLRALLLAACDKGNNLWRIPAEISRPRQLTTPPRFIEHNLWLVIEAAVRIWASGGPAVPLTHWPEGPPDSGGICLYQGRIKEIARRIDQIPVGAVISALPRPNQAFWTLSALWAGWLWGRQAIGPFARVLQRRRYDWVWHTAALTRSLKGLVEILPENTPFFGMVTENEAGFDAAAASAADLAGFVLEDVALRVREGQTQFVWRKLEQRPEPDLDAGLRIVKDSLQEIINQRGEPTPYLQLQAAALLNLSQHNAITVPKSELGESTTIQAGNTYNRVRQLMLEALIPTGDLIRYQGGRSSIEIGKWWTKNASRSESPLADRVEISLVNLLQAQPVISWAEIDAALCEQFPGLLTPDQRLIRMILTSYAEQDQSGNWHLRANDIAASRQKDITEIEQLLCSTGERLGFTVKKGEPLIWEHALNQSDLHFYLIASTVLSRILDAADHRPEEGVVVLPGGRAGLVMYKRERDPRLSYRLDGGWRILKFRHVRRMWESKSLSEKNLASYLVLDPIAHDEAQLPLL